jgi:C-terminal processing protease CtpA/Prc
VKATPLKAPLVAWFLLLLPLLPARVGAAPAAEEPILMPRFVVNGRSLQESGLGLDVRLHRGKGTGLVIDEPLVRSVVTGGGAAKAGIAPGDVLVRVGDVPTDGMDARHWHEEYVRAHEGETVRFLFRKAGSKKTVLIKLQFVP